MSGAPRVIVIGAGLAGMATAIAATEHGCDVVVIEKNSSVGGAAAYSGGQVWVPANHVQARMGIEDSATDAEQYIRFTSRDHPELLDDDLLHTWLSESPRAAIYFEELGVVEWTVIPGYPDYFLGAPGSRPEGRYLTAVFDANELGDRRQDLLVSPYFPMGLTYGDVFNAGQRASAFGNSAEAAGSSPSTDLLTFGPGVVGGFFAGALRRGLDIRVQTEALELVLVNGCVTGVIVRTAAGTTEELDGQVVLCTSAFDWDPLLVKEFVGVDPDNLGSLAPTSISGDGLRMARESGAAIRVFPAEHMPMVLGYQVEGEPRFAPCREHQLPHTFLVNTAGERFCDDALYWEVVKASMSPDSPNLPFWMIWDSQHHQKYGLGATPPGGIYPEGLVAWAQTLEELGGLLGIDPNGLAATASQFNTYAGDGLDPVFGRGTNVAARMFAGDPRHEPNGAVGSVEAPPFYGMRVRLLSTAIGLTGVVTDGRGRALSEEGEAIPGLYAAGSAAAFGSSGTGYNSGFALSRAITTGLLVAEELVGGRLQEE